MIKEKLEAVNLENKEINEKIFQALMQTDIGEAQKILGDSLPEARFTDSMGSPGRNIVYGITIANPNTQSNVTLHFDVGLYKEFKKLKTKKLPFDESQVDSLRLYSPDRNMEISISRRRYSSRKQKTVDDLKKVDLYTFLYKEKYKPLYINPYRYNVQGISNIIQDYKSDFGSSQIKLRKERSDKAYSSLSSLIKSQVYKINSEILQKVSDIFSYYLIQKEKQEFISSVKYSKGLSKVKPEPQTLINKENLFKLGFYHVGVEIGEYLYLVIDYSNVVGVPYFSLSRITEYHGSDIKIGSPSDILESLKKQGDLWPINKQSESLINFLEKRTEDFYESKDMTMFDYVPEEEEERSL